MARQKGLTKSLLLVTLLAATLISGCGGPDKKPGSVINRGLGGDIDTLDVHRARSTQSHRVQDDILQGLLGYSANGTLEPGVAREWDVSPDGLLYSFSLRQNARWSNGDPVTANDFVVSLRRLVDPNTAGFYATFVSVIENAERITTGELPPETLGVFALDDYTLEIRLSRPTPYFPQLLTHPATSPVHSPSLEKYGSQFARAENIVTNGPYKVDQYVMSSKLSLSRNPYYWDNENTSIDRVNYLAITDNSVEYTLYRTGELDITFGVAPGQFHTIREERPTELRVAPQLGLYYYGLNLTKPPFAGNKQLRQAVSMAIDRELLVAKVSGRGEVAAYSWVPPGIDGYQSEQFDYASMPRDERLAIARTLYQEAGYTEENPLKFELRYNTGEFESTMAVAIQSMWRTNLGAEVELINEEFQVLLSNIQMMEITQAYRLSWIGDYNDADTYLQLMMTGNPMNLTGYSNETVDSLLAQASTELSLEKRQRLMRQAERILLDDHPAIPLYYYVSKHLVNPKIQGWEDNVLDRHPTKHLSIAE